MDHGLQEPWATGGPLILTLVADLDEMKHAALLS